MNPTLDQPEDPTPVLPPATSDANDSFLVRPPSLAPDPPSPPEAGQRIGSYTLVRQLGRGGMGSVWLATREQPSMKVAIKFILPERATPAFVERFQRERQLLADQEHPNVARLLDGGTTDTGQPYMVMEYIEAVTLREYLRAKPVTLELRLRLFLQVCEGVRHAHLRGVLHRDLKPDNILVTAAGVAKVIDFGLVQGIGGTLSYMSPEQTTLPAEQLQPFTDQYSLGVILYEMLTSRLPCDLPPALAAALRVIREQRPRPLEPAPRDRPRDLEAVVHKALAKEPRDRYDDVEAFAADVSRYLEVKSVQARPAGRPQRVWYWVRRHPATAVARVLAVLLVVASPIWALRESGLHSLAEAERRKAVESERQALEQTGIAVRERGRSQDLTHQANVKAARYALSRGQWAEARHAFDQAIAQNNPDRLELRVERLRCLYALESRRELIRELDELTRLELPPHLRAAVDLHEGDVGLWNILPVQQVSAVKKLKAALAAPAGLTEADRAYVRGLLADGTPEAVGHFRAALKEDAFHHRANVALLLELTLSGQFEEADRRALFLRDVFGADVATLFSQAFMAVQRDDRLALRRHLDDLRAAVRLPADRQRLENAFQVFENLVAAKTGSYEAQRPVQKKLEWVPPQGAAFAPVFQLHKLLGQDSDRALGTTLGLGAPLLRRPVALVTLMMAVQRRLEVQSDPIVTAQLAKQGCERHPEALLLALYATARFQLAWGYYQGNQPDAFQRELLAARALYLQAAEAPTIIPAGPYRHQSRWMAFFAETCLRMHFRPHQPVLAAGLAGHLALAGHGPSPLQATLATPLAAYPPGCWPDRRLLLRLAHDSGPDDDARPATYHAIADFLEPEDARLLLADWAADTPFDPMPLRFRAQLELRTGNYHAALDFANRVLVLVPDDPPAKAVRTEALKKVGKVGRDK